MVFKNEKELKTFLLAKCKKALMKTQEQAYQIINRFIRQYYSEYTPDTNHGGYQRTNQLLHSLVKSDIVPTHNGYEAKVYVDLGYLNYIYPDGDKPSGADVMDAANQGIHGLEHVAMIGGTEIWDEPMQILDAKAISILKTMLISEGIPIK